VARLISLYAYERQRTTGTGHSSQGPIEAWIEHRLSEKNALENFQTMHLLGVPTADDLDLAHAKRLVDQFFLVGLTDEYDRSLELLGQRAGLGPDDLRYERVNVTNSKERFPVSSATRQRLLDLNLVDAQLYEYARNKLAADLARLPVDGHQQHSTAAQHGPERTGWRQVVNRIRNRWAR
jgi:hypothetical protein